MFVPNQIQQIKEEKIGLCGFKNLGNTCYMNSILQLIIHSKTLINFLLCETNPFIMNNEENEENETFASMVITEKIKAPFIKFLKTCSIEKLSEMIKNTYKMNDDDDIMINSRDLKLYIENTLTIKLAELVNLIVYQGNSSVNPSGIKKIIDKKIPSMRGFSQQDAHELLIGIFDILIEETCIDSEPVINNVPNVIEEYINIVEKTRIKLKNTNSIEKKKDIMIELNKYKEKNKDVVNKFNGLKFMSNVFGVKRKNSLDTTTTGYNPLLFNLLTFDVNTFTCVECNNCVHKYEFNTILSLNVKSTLEECFDDYIQKEQIDRKCEVCSNAKTIKQKYIWRPGMILFIQLCRFNNLPNGDVWKNNKDVQIPDTIDLSKYCDNSMKTNNSLSYKYKLKGISNHMGSLNGGHYTADATSIVDDKNWYHFNDSFVERHQTSTFDTSSAYILMYEIE